MKNTEGLMRYINKCIVGNSFNFDEFSDVLNEQDLSAEDRLYILRSIETNKSNLTKVNRDLYDYFYNKEQQAKHDKAMKKFRRNQASQQELEEAYKQYENYVYSIVSMKNYKSKPGKTNVKVHLYTIENLFGHDSEEAIKDVLQEGRKDLFEGIKKFGVLPDKAKNFEGRIDKGHTRSLSSMSTFAHQNLFNALTNLSKKSSSVKFKVKPPAEYDDVNILGKKDDEDGI